MRDVHTVSNPLGSIPTCLAEDDIEMPFREARYLNRLLISHSEELLEEIAEKDDRIVALTNELVRQTRQVRDLMDHHEELLAQLKQADGKSRF